MKKFFSFAAALLLSVCAFADRTIVPNPSDLTSFDPEHNAVLCVYFDEQVCNDVILIGDATDWNTTNTSAFVKMRPVTGFEGWYAAGVAKSDNVDQKFKPIQLKADGSFSWDFQCGGPDAWVKANPAGATLDVQSELGGAECGLHYTAPGAYIYYCTHWKNHNTPCQATHNYKICVYAPDCDYVEPTIAGGFDNWADVNHEMDFDVDEEGNQYYYFVMEGQLPGIGYKIKGGNGWDNNIQVYVDTADTWWNVNDYFCGGKDWQLGEDTVVVYHWENPDMYRYETCEEPVECDSIDYTVNVTFPACEGAAPAIIGTFNNWNAAAMTLVSGTTYTITVKALCTDKFKFNDAVLGWDNELINAEGGKFNDTAFGEEATITLDLSETYNWMLCSGTAVENVVAAPKAAKFIENGQLIMVVDGVRYNAVGVKL